MFRIHTKQLTAKILLAVMLMHPALVAAKGVVGVLNTNPELRGLVLSTHQHTIYGSGYIPTNGAGSAQNTNNQNTSNQRVPQQVQAARVAAQQAQAAQQTQQLSGPNFADFTLVQQNTSSGVEVDVNAANNQTAAIKESANGTSVIDIAEASQAGVSHNLFSKFNVDENGLILNNSLNPIISQLGGWTDGNRRLAGGTARIILAEVTGNSASTLLGFTEILGDSAEFVLANSNGIACNGCGFINTPRVTFATGTPDVQGGELLGFTINSGSVIIDGAGLNASNISKFDVLTKAMYLNSALYANELNIYTGNNYVGYAEGDIQTLSNQPGETPFQFVLDASALGSMYVNSIKLVGTEAGLGVRSEGLISATNQLELTVDGEIRLKDTVTNGQANITSNSGNVVLDGTTHGQEVSISAGETVENNGTVSSNSNINIQANNIDQFGAVFAGINEQGQLGNLSNITLETQGKIVNQGNILTLGDIQISANEVENQVDALVQADSIQSNVNALTNTGTLLGSSLAFDGSSLTNAGTIQGENIVISSETLNQEQGLIYQSSADGQLTITNQQINIADGLIAHEGAAQINTTESVSNAGSWLSNGQLTIASEEINNTGTMQIQTDVQINAARLNNSGTLLFNGETAPEINLSESLNNDNGSIQVNTNLAIDTDHISNQQGRIVLLGEDAQSTLTSSTQFNNTEGEILSNGQIAIQGNILNNNLGTISGTGIELDGGDVSNVNGIIQANTVGINATTLDNSSGQIVSVDTEADSLNLVVTDSLVNREGVILSQNQSLNLTTQNLDNTLGTIALTGAGVLSIEALNEILNNEGAIQANTELNLNTASLINLSGVINAQQLTIQATELRNTSGTIFGEQVSLAGSHLFNQGGIITARLAEENNESGANSLLPILDIAYTDLIDNSAEGVIESHGQDLTFNTENLINDNGHIAHIGLGVLTIDALIASNNEGSLVTNGDALLNIGDLSSINGSLSAVGSLSLTGQNLTNDNGTILSNELSIDVATLSNEEGVIQGITTANISADDLHNLSGQINAQSLILNSDSINNEGGTLIAEHIELSANTINNNAGVLMATQAITQTENDALILNADQIDNVGGTIFAENSNLTIDANTLDNQDGTIVAATDLVMNADSLNNQAGYIGNNAESSAESSDEITGDISITSQTLVNDSGSIVSGGDLTIQASTLDNSAGIIQSEQNANLDVSGQINNLSGSIVAGNGMTINAGNIQHQDGTLQATENLSIQTGDLQLSNNAVISAVDVQLAVTNLEVSSDSIVNGQTLSIDASQINNAGLLLAAGTDSNALTIEANSLLNSGRIESHGQDFDLSNITINNSGGEIVHFGSGVLSLEFQSELNNSDGLLLTQGDLDLVTNGIVNNAGQIVASGSATISTGVIDNTLGVIQSGSELNINASQLQNNSGSLTSLGGSQSTINVQRELLNRDGTLVLQSGNNQINAGSLDNGNGTLSVGTGTSASNLQIKTGQLNNQGGTLQVINGTLNLNAGNRIENTAGTIYASGAGTQITTNQLNNQNGSIIQKGSGALNVSSGIINNSGTGQIASDKALVLTGQALTNTGIISGSNVEITTQSIVNGGDLVASQLNLTANSLANTGNVVTDSAVLNLTRLDNSGRIQAVSTASNNIFTLKAETLNNQGSITTNAADFSLTNMVINNQNGRLVHQGLGVLTIEALGDLNNQGGVISTDGSFVFTADSLDNRQGTLQVGQSADINLQDVNNEGGSILLLGNDSLSLNIANSLNNNQGVIQANSDQVDINALTVENQDGVIDVAGQLNILTQTITNTGGQINGGGLNISVDAINNQNGQIAAFNTEGESLVLTVANGIDNTDGVISSAGETSTINAATLNNENGNLSFAGDAELNITQIDNLGAGEIVAGGQMTLNATDLANEGLIQADQLTLNTPTIINSGNISATGAVGESLILNTETLTNSGLIFSNGEDLNITNVALINDNGSIVHAGTGILTIEALSGLSNDISNIGGEILTEGQLVITADTLNNELGLVQSGDSSALTLNTLNNLSGVVNAGGVLTAAITDLNNENAQLIASHLNVTTDTLNNTSGQLIATGETGQSFDLQIGTSLNNNQGQILGAGESGNINTPLLNNSDGVINLAGTGELAINSAQLDNLGAGSISANGTLSLAGTTLTNAGSISANNIAATFSQFSNSGDVASNQDLILNHDQLVNSGNFGAETATLNISSMNNSGVLAINGTQQESLNFNVDSLINTGTIVSNGQDLALQNITIDNNGGSLLHFGTGILTLEALGEIQNVAGTLITSGQLNMLADSFNNQSGLLQIAGAAQISLDEFSNVNGEVALLGEQLLQLVVTNLIDNQNGNIEAAQIALDAATLNNTSGQIAAVGETGSNLTLQITGLVNNTDGLIYGGGENATLTANQISNLNGTIQHAGTGVLLLDSHIIEHSGTGSIIGNGVVTINADNLTSNSLISSQSTMNLTATQINNQAQANIVAGDLNVVASSLVNEGAINAQNTVITADAVINSGQLSADGFLELTADTLTNDNGQLETTGTLQIDAVELSNIQGDIRTLGTDGLTINVQNTLNNTTGVIEGNSGIAHITATQINNSDGDITIAGDLTIDAQSLINQQGQIAAQNSALNITNIDNTDAGQLSATGNLAITSTDIQSDGVIAGDSVNIITSTLNNQSNALLQANALLLNSQTLTNAGGIESDTTTITSATIINTGAMQTESALTLNATTLSNEGLLLSEGSLDLTAATITNDQGDISAESINIHGTNLSNINGGQIAAFGTNGERLALNVTDTLDNQSVIYAAGENAVITASVLNNSGQIEHTGANTLSINAATLNNEAVGSITSNNSLVISATDLTNAGALSATNNSILANEVTNSGSLISEMVNLAAQQLDNTGIIEGQNVQLTLDSLNNAGRIAAANSVGESLIIDANTVTNTGSVVSSGEHFTLQQLTLDNNGGDILHFGTGVLTIEALNTLQNQSGLVYTAGSLDLSAGTLDNQVGRILTDNLSANVQTIINTDGVLLADNNLQITSNILGNQNGAIIANGNTGTSLNINATTLIDNSTGTIYGAGERAQITTAEINNQAGVIKHEGTDHLVLTSTNLDNTLNGQILSNSGLDINAQSLTNNGSIAAQNIDIVSTAINNQGEIDAAVLTFQGDTLTNSGDVAAINAAININSINNSGLLAATGSTGVGGESLVINANQITNTGILASYGENFSLANLALNNENGNIIHAGTGVLNLDTLNELRNVNGLIRTDGSLSVAAVSLNNTSGNIQAENSALIQVQDLINQAGDIAVFDNGTLTVNATQSINNNAGLLGANNINLQTGSLNNASGEILASQTAIDTLQLNNNAGDIRADKLILNTNTLTNANGLISANSYLDLTANTTLDNNQGAILTTGSTAEINAGDLINDDGLISQLSNNDLTVTATGTISGVNGVIRAEEQLSISANALNNQGTIGANAINVGTETLTNSGIMQAGQMLITTSNFNNQGLLLATDTADQSLKINTVAGIVNSGTIQSHGTDLIFTESVNNSNGKIIHAGTGVLSFDALTNQSGFIHAENNLLVQSGHLDNSNGLIQANNDLSITGQVLTNTNGVLRNGGDLSLNLQTLDNQSGTVSSQGNITNISVAENILNTSGTIASSADNVSIAAQQIVNNGGLISAQGELDVTAQQYSSVAGSLTSQSTLNLNVNNIINNGGALISANNTNITGQIVNNNTGKIESANSMVLNVNNMSNQGGLVLSAGNNFTLNLQNSFDNSAGGQLEVHSTNWHIDNQNINNQSGVLRHMGDGELRVSQLNNQLNNQNGFIGSAGNVVLDLQGQIAGVALNNQNGAIQATGALDINTPYAINNANGRLLAEGGLAINADTLDNQNGRVIAGQGLSVELISGLQNDSGLIYNDSGTFELSAANLNNGSGVLLQNGAAQMTLNADTLTSSGEIGANSVLKLNASTFNNSGKVQGGVLNLTATSFNNSGAMSGNLVTVNTNNFNNNSGYIEAKSTSGESLVINTANGISNQGGTIQSSGSSLNLATALNNTNGEVILLSNGTLNVTNVDNDGGALLSRGNISSTGSLSNQSGVIQASNNVALTQSTINNVGGNIHAGNGLAISANGLNNQSGKLSSSGNQFDVNINGSINNSAGGVMATTASNMNVRGNSLGNQSGTIKHLGAGNLTLTGFSTLNNNSGVIDTAGNVSLSLTSLSNDNGVVSANSATINAGSISNRGGSLQANNLSISANGLNNTGGLLLGKGSSGNALSLNVNGTLTNNTGGVIESHSQNLNLANVGSLSNAGGQIRHHGTGSLNIQQSGAFSNNNGLVYTKGALDFDSGNLNNDSGTLFATGQSNINAGNISNSAGKIEAGSHLNVNGSSINNSNGNLVSGGNLTVGTSGDLNNASGVIFAQGSQLNINANGVDNNGGTLGSNGDAIIAAGALLNNDGGIVQVDNSAIISATNVNNNNGALQGGNLTINATQTITNTGNGVITGGVVALSGSALNNTSGTLYSSSTSDNSLALSGLSSITNNNGMIGSNARNWSLALNGLSNTNGSLIHQGAGTFSVGQSGILNNDGTIASAGNLQITASGVTNSANLQAVNLLTVNGGLTNTASGLLVAKNIAVNASGKTVSNSGNIIANSAGVGVLSIDALTLSNSGTLYGADSATLNAGTLTNSGNVSSETLNIGGFGTLTNTGRIESMNGTYTGTTFNNNAGGVLISAGTGASAMALNVNQLNNAGAIYNTGGNMSFGGSITNSGTITHAGTGSLTLGDKGSVNVAGGTIATAGTATLMGSVAGAGGVYAQTGMVINSSGTFTNANSQLYTEGNLQINSAVNNQGGQLLADGTLGINTSGTVTNSSGTIQGQNLNITSGFLANDNGTITSTGTGAASINATSIDNSNGTIQSLGNGLSVATSSGDINNNGGTIKLSSTGSLAINARTNLANSSGLVLSNGAVNVSTGAALNNANGYIQGNGFDLNIGTSVQNNNGNIIGFGGGSSQLRTGGSVTNTGGKIASDGANLTLNTGAINNRNGGIELVGTGLLAITASSVQSDGASSKIGSNGAVNLNAGSSLVNAGQITAKNNLTIAASSMSNSNIVGSLSGAANMSVTGTLTNTGSISGASSTTINANSVNNTSGNIQSAGTVGITSGSLSVGSIAGGNVDVNLGGGLTVNSGEFISSTGNVDISTGGAVTNRGNIRASGSLGLSGTSLSNTSDIRSGGNNNLNFSGNLSNSGILSSNSTLTINGGTLTNSGTVAGTNLDINTNVNNTNLLYAASNMSIDGSLTNSSSVYSSGNATINGGTITNNAGKISAAGNLTLSGTIRNNRSGSTSFSQGGSSTTVEYTDGEGLFYKPVDRLAGGGSIWYRTKEVRTTTVYNATATGSAGVIAAGNTLRLNGNTTNNYSTISAGGNLYVSGNLTNNSIQNRNETDVETIKEKYFWDCLQAWGGGKNGCAEPGEITSTSTVEGSSHETTFAGSAHGTIAAGGSIIGNVTGLQSNDANPLGASGSTAGTAASGSAGSANRGNSVSGSSAQNASVSGTNGNALSTAGQNLNVSGNASGVNVSVTASNATADGSIGASAGTTSGSGTGSANASAVTSVVAQNTGGITTGSQTVANTQSGTNNTVTSLETSINTEATLVTAAVVNGGSVSGGNAHGVIKNPILVPETPQSLTVDGSPGANRNGTGSGLAVISGNLALDVQANGSEVNNQVVSEAPLLVNASVVRQTGTVAGPHEKTIGDVVIVSDIPVATQVIVDNTGITQKSANDDTYQTTVDGRPAIFSGGIVQGPEDDGGTTKPQIVTGPPTLVAVQPVTGGASTNLNNGDDKYTTPGIIVPPADDSQNDGLLPGPIDGILQPTTPELAIHLFEGETNTIEGGLNADGVNGGNAPNISIDGSSPPPNVNYATETRDEFLQEPLTDNLDNPDFIAQADHAAEATLNDMEDRQDNLNQQSASTNNGTGAENTAPTAFTLESIGLTDGDVEVAQNIFMTDEQVAVLTGELGFNEDFIRFGQHVLYGAISQNDLLADGVTIGAGDTIDITSEGDINIDAGIAANNAVVLRTEESLNYTGATFIDSQNIGLQIGNDFTNTLFLEADNLALDIGGEFINDGLLTGFDSLQVSSGGDFTNNADILAGNSLLLGSANGDFTNNSDIISGGFLGISAGNDLFNTSGSTIAGVDVALEAGGDIINRREQYNYSFSGTNSQGDYLMEGAWGGQGANLISQNSLSMNAGNNVDLTGSELSAAGNISIFAGNDVILGAIENTTNREQHFKGGYDKSYDTTWDVTRLISGGNLTVSAGNNLESQGAEFIANGDIGLSAGNELNLDAVIETHASASKRTKKGFLSKKVTIKESHHDTVQGSTLLAGGDILLNAAKTENGIATQQSGDVNIIGGNLQADGNMVIAGNNVNIEAQAYTDYEMEYKFKSKFGGLSSKEQMDAEATQKLSGSTLIAGAGNGNSEGSLTIVAADDATILASDLQAAGDVNLSVFDELVIASGEEIQQIDKMRKSGGLFSGGSLYSLKESINSTTTITADSSLINAGGNININTGSALVVGSDLNAGGNLAVSTDIGDIEIRAAQEGTYEYSYDKEVNVGLGDVLSMNPTDFIKVEDGKINATIASASYDEVEATTDETTHRSSNLNANGNVVLDSVGDILIEGSNIIADADDNGEGGVGLLAGNGITVKEATNTFVQDVDETHGEAELSVVVQNNYVEAGKAILAIDDAKDQLKQANQDYRKYKKELDQLEGTLAQLKADYDSGKPGVDYNDIADLQELVNDLQDDEKWYQTGIALATVNLASKTTLAMQQSAAAINSSGFLGFDAGIQLDVSATQTQTHTEETTSVGSFISGADITIATGFNDATEFGQSGNTLIQGSTLLANNDLTIATGNLDVLASRDTFEQTVETQDASISIQQTFYGTAGGPSVNASYGQSRSEDKATTYNNSILSAENINITTANDASFIGANVDASSNLNLTVGGDLQVESKQNRTSGSNHSFGISAGIGFGSGEGMSGDSLANSAQNLGSTNGEVSSANGGLNVANGRYMTKETVLTTLTAGNEANINVAGNTDIKGALIATLDENGNDLGNLNLTTDTLSFTDLNNRSFDTQTALSFSTNVGISDAANSNDSSSNAPANPNDSGTSLSVNSSNVSISTSTQASGGNTLATIGQGTVIVNNEADSENLDAINRDTDNITNELYNTDTGMSVDATIDHRLFTEDGRKDIKEDFKRTEILAESIADVITEEEVSLFGDGDGEQSMGDHIQNKQDYFTATKNFSTNPNNETHVATLTNSDATPEQKQAAYTALANSIATQLGVSLVEAKVLVATDPRFGGALSTETNNLYVNDAVNETSADAASTIGHEIAHHVQHENGDIAVTVQGEENLEGYAELMGEATEDYLSFNFAQEEHGDLDATNNHSWGTSTEEVRRNIDLVRDNTKTFKSENPDDLAFNILLPPITPAAGVAGGTTVVAGGTMDHLNQINASGGANHNEVIASGLDNFAENIMENAGDFIEAFSITMETAIHGTPQEQHANAFIDQIAVLTQQMAVARDSGDTQAVAVLQSEYQSLQNLMSPEVSVLVTNLLATDDVVDTSVLENPIVTPILADTETTGTNLESPLYIGIEAIENIDASTILEGGLLDETSNTEYPAGDGLEDPLVYLSENGNGEFGSSYDSVSKTRDEAFNKAKDSLGVPTQQQPEFTVFVEDRNTGGMLPVNVYKNSNGEYVAIREDNPIVYPDGGSQGYHFNSGVLNSSEIMKEVNSGKNIRDVVKSRLSGNSDKLKQHHNYGD